MLHIVAYTGRDPVFGHEICRIMYNGPHYSDILGQLACFAQSFANSFAFMALP